jgi:GntR family galactonate operon transcriptional repressor
MKHKANGSSSPRATGQPRSNGWRRKADGILDQLGQKVVSGHYAPGRRLPTETDLAQELGVSRPSLREGLQALARKGLVDSRPRRGTTILDKNLWDIFDPDVLRWMQSAEPDPAFMIALLEARKIIEPAAARLATMRGSAAQILDIENAFRGMTDSMPHDVETSRQYDVAFHEAIFAAAGNPLLLRFMLAIRSGLFASMRVSMDARDGYENSLAEHGAVASAIRKRDPDAAEQAMHALLAGTTRDLSLAFEHPPASGSESKKRQLGRGRRAKPSGNNNASSNQKTK